MEKKKSAFGTAGLVVGIVGVALSFIPIVNNAAFVLGVLGVIFGGISLAKKASLGKAIAGLVCGILAIVITLVMQNSVSNALDDLTGDNTEDILASSVDVTFGEFTVTEKDYISDSQLEVKVTNKSDEKHSFIITIEAVAEDGSRIESDTLYINDLNAGQSTTEQAFTLVSSDKYEQLQKAEFKVVEASMI